ncbi:hypothetical protein AB4072_08985 [Microvirga sp. 2MCAF38]|uniref:hypothetical protein n=1 Tax=Microvirga sp. 2MCAF38 TaxID=3232989 RepID=UPI003F9B21BE
MPRSSKQKTRSQWFGGAIAILIFCLGTPVDAAQAKKPLPKGTAAKISSVLSKKEPQATTSSTGGKTLPGNCQRARKRLFVEGEGWIVRRLTTCF